MSKTPAQKSSPKKPAVKAGAAAPAKGSKTAPKAAKHTASAPAKSAAEVKAASSTKSAPAAAKRPAASDKKPAAPAPQVAAKAAPAPAAAKPAPQPPLMKPAPSPVVPEASAVPAAPKKPSRAASKYPPPAAPAPLPAPTSRFADRVAPPRPPTRQMNSNLELDTPREKHKADPKLANAWKSKAGRDLTEAEVLAMPDSEYMNDKQLEFFRAKLQALKDDLLSNAGETTEHLREDTSIVPDPADRATIEEEHALELRTRDRERKLLKKISQSLQRIDAADYGFCDETGEPIGLGRLIARPTATLSLEAQQRRELKQKMFGD